MSCSKKNVVRGRMRKLACGRFSKIGALLCAILDEGLFLWALKLQSRADCACALAWDYNCKAAQIALALWHGIIIAKPRRLRVRFGIEISRAEKKTRQIAGGQLSKIWRVCFEKLAILFLPQEAEGSGQTAILHRCFRQIPRIFRFQQTLIRRPSLSICSFSRCIRSCR